MTVRLTVVAGAVLLTACVRHQAAVTVDDDLVGATAVVNAGSNAPLTGTQQRSGHLPQRLLIHGYLRDEQGLVFLDADVRSPLAWWQRFPVDLVSGVLWPGTVTSRADGSLSRRRPAPLDPARLTALAQAAGYPSTDGFAEE